MAKRKHKRRVKNAKYYGDNPKIRRKYGEAKNYDDREAWERYYRRKKALKRLGDMFS